MSLNILRTLAAREVRYRTEAKRKTLILRVSTVDQEDERYTNPDFQEFPLIFRDKIQKDAKVYQHVLETARFYVGQCIAITFEQQGKEFRGGFEVFELDGEVTKEQYESLMDFTHRNVKNHPCSMDFWAGIVDD